MADAEPLREDGPGGWILQRRKACIVCTRAKRRCDKKLPSCNRCLDRQVVCQYPSTRPYARRSAPSSANANAELLETPATAVAAVTSESAALRADGGGGGGDPSTAWANNNQLETSEPGANDDQANDMLLLGAAGQSDEENELLGFGGSIDGGDTDPADSSWFMRNETWAIHQRNRGNTNHHYPRTPLVLLRQFIRAVKQWLQQWMEENHCPFIHGQLFAETGFPQCLQDAYSALAAYANKTEKNEDMVMQLIEEKSNALLRQHQPQEQQSSPFADNPTDDMYLSMSLPVLRTIDHLARVQALFIYQFIRLFDGDIRQRALAERQIPTLTSWIKQLWTSANLDASLQTTFGDGSYPFAENDMGTTSSSSSPHEDGIYAVAKVWRDWLLSESVRRTWLVANYTQCIYLTLRDGMGPCEGTVQFTARRGLWDAASAGAWLRRVRSHDPLFLPCYETDQLFFSAIASEVDIFALAAMSLTWDSVKFDAWISKSPDVRLRAILRVPV
ncbi:Transcription factor gsfR2-like protein [Cladobotryum mycophilum]|uniref:Transcription factor gsfR2-like protein n=1 Tax=Cladobotryum mycophilum TaxID=491253 RepID=A0ABR0SB23_9HYPO